MAAAEARRDGHVPDSSSSVPINPETPELLSSHATQNQERSSGLQNSPRRGVSFNDPMPGDTQASGPSEDTPITSASRHPDRNYDSTNDAQNAVEPHLRTRQRPQAKSASNAESSPNRQQSWWKRVTERYGAVSLENKGSVARDHLALERTFLAWLRTSLAFASIGIAVTQLFRLNTSIRSQDQATFLFQDRAAPSSHLPLSPLLGHGIPVELIPYLQQLSASDTTALPASRPGGTLLDQLLAQSAHSTFARVLQAPDDRTTSKLPHIGKPLGATFIAVSIVVLFVGFHRYFEAQYWVIRGKFPASRGSVALVGFVAAALIIASLVVVLVLTPLNYAKR